MSSDKTVALHIETYAIATGACGGKPLMCSTLEDILKLD